MHGYTLHGSVLMDSIFGGRSKLHALQRHRRTVSPGRSKGPISFCIIFDIWLPTVGQVFIPISSYF